MAFHAVGLLAWLVGQLVWLIATRRHGLRNPVHDDVPHIRAH